MRLDTAPEAREMETLFVWIVVIAALLALDAGALRWGVDSRWISIGSAGRMPTIVRSNAGCWLAGSLDGRPSGGRSPSRWPP